MPRKQKIVQGSYIHIDSKKTLEREAERQEIHVSTLTSEILEREAKKIQRKEKRGEYETLPANKTS